MKTSPFVSGYLSAIIFAESDCARENENDDTSLESAGYSIADFDAQSMAHARSEAASFQWNARKLLRVAYAERPDYDAHAAGCDFYFSAAHHGTGFWDRGLSVGQALHSLAGSNSFCVFANDDGTLTLD